MSTLPSTQEGADALIPRLHEFRNLRNVGIGAIDLSGDHLRELGTLTDVVRLTLGSCDIDDDDLQYLSDLEGLGRLYLNHNPIEGDGLRHLAGLENLRYLDLGLTQISGPGLEHLKELTNLRSLSLSNTPIDDDGLDYVTQLDNIPLTKLILSSTNITPDGLMKLVDLHWLDDGLGIPDDIADPPEERAARRQFPLGSRPSRDRGLSDNEIAARRRAMLELLARFHEAHFLSRQAAEAAGEVFSERHFSPYGSVFHELYPNREPGEE